MKFSKFHQRMMQEVITLAKKGCGTTGKNPRVGAILVKNNRIISRGFHKQAGSPHAEATAIKLAGKKARGASLYVNMEPCCHFGNTPPCTDAIIGAGIKRVFYSIDDPDIRNRGRAEKILKKNRIIVYKGLLKQDAENINAGFIKRNTKLLPYLTLKLAISLDGKIATSDGQSKWITSENSRRIVQKLRMQTDAILVGIKTVLKDNPSLSLRGKNGAFLSHQPYKVILDSDLRIPLNCNVLKSSPNRVIIVCKKRCSKDRIKKLAGKNVTVWQSHGLKEFIDVRWILKKLAKELSINYILCEGGAKVASSLLEQGCVDKIIFFIAPILIGGDKSCTGEIGVKKLSSAIKLKNIKYSFALQYNPNVLRKNKADSSLKDLIVEADVYRNS